MAATAERARLARLVLNSVQDPTAVIDGTGAITSVNAAWTSSAGLLLATAVGADYLACAERQPLRESPGPARSSRQSVPCSAGNCASAMSNCAQPEGGGDRSRSCTAQLWRPCSSSPGGRQLSGR